MARQYYSGDSGAFQNVYDNDSDTSKHLTWEHYAASWAITAMLASIIPGLSIYNYNINEANKVILGTDSGLSSHVIVEQSKGESISNFLLSQNANINNISDILGVIDVETNKMLEVADRNAFSIKTNSNFITDDIKNTFNPTYKDPTGVFFNRVIDPYAQNDFINENIGIEDYVQILEAVYNVKAAHHFNQDVFKYDIETNTYFNSHTHHLTYESDWMDKMGKYLITGEKSNQEIFQFINIDYEKIAGTDKDPYIEDFTVTQSSSADDSLQTNPALQMFLHLDPNALAEVTPNKFTLDNLSSTATYDNTKQAMKIGLDGQVVEKTESLKQ